MPGDPGHFSAVVEALKCLLSLYIYLYDFYKTSGVPGGARHFSEAVEATECLSNLETFLDKFCKTPGVPKGLTFFWSCRSPRRSVKLVNIFYDFQKTPGVPGVPKHFSEVVDSPESLSTF